MLKIRLLILLSCLFLFSCGDSDILLQGLFDISGAPLGYDESQASKHLAIASVCLECDREKPKNILKIQTMINKIMDEKPETELIVFGETTLGWYYNQEDKNYQYKLAETIPGETTDLVGLLAKQYGIYIVLGLGEINNSRLYNSQVLINPDGLIEAIHRKHHLLDEDKESGFEYYEPASDNVTVVDINGIKTGLIICADVSSYWLTEQLNSQDVELIIHSLASFEPEFNIDPVARQFNAWTVFANRYGRENDNFYEGNCYIADPAGTIRTGGNGSQRYEFFQIGVY